jgi:hypothetical protein
MARGVPAIGRWAPRLPAAAPGIVSVTIAISRMIGLDSTLPFRLRRVSRAEDLLRRAESGECEIAERGEFTVAAADTAVKDLAQMQRQPEPRRVEMLDPGRLGQRLDIRRTARAAASAWRQASAALAASPATG